MFFQSYICLVKKLLIIIALIMFFKPILPVVDYIINYEYISKVLCVNKAKPELKCNGKCQLMKNLAKAEEDEKPISPEKKSNTQEIELLFFQEIQSLIPLQTSFQHKSIIPNNYSCLYFRLNSCSVFHPPSLVV